MCRTENHNHLCVVPFVVCQICIVSLLMIFSIVATRLALFHSCFWSGDHPFVGFPDCPVLTFSTPIHTCHVSFAMAFQKAKSINFVRPDAPILLLIMESTDDRLHFSIKSHENGPFLSLPKSNDNRSLKELSSNVACNVVATYFHLEPSHISGAPPSFMIVIH